MRKPNWFCLPVLLAGMAGWAALSLRAATPPANDNFADALLLSGLTNQVTASNQGASKEAGEPSHAQTFGTNSVWWRWTAPVTGTFSLSTIGSSFDTILAVYTGSSVSNLTEIASDDDSGPKGTSAVNFRATAGLTYSIVVDGAYGARGTILLTMQPGGYPSPAWQLTSLDGSVVRSADFAGRVLILDFWETQCAACLDEIPSYISLISQYAASGLSAVGISVDTISAGEVGSFAGTLGMNYPVVFSNDQLRNALGGVELIPTTFIIDRAGNIVAKNVTYTTYATLESEVLPLLADPAFLVLRARVTTSGVEITWPAAFTTYQLQSGDLGATPNWSPVSKVARARDGYNTVTLPLSGTGKIYRLKGP